MPGDTNGKLDVFVYDRTLAQMERVSVGTDGAEGNDDSSEPAISADGRYVTFRSAATNLVADDSNGNDDIFLHDRNTGISTRISVTASGLQGDGFSRRAAISRDGFFIAFESASTDFGFDDNFGAVDIFLGVREDACPADPGKLFAGVCGCGTPDTDGDRDGTPDCLDGCPSDPGKVSPALCWRQRTTRRSPASSASCSARPHRRSRISPAPTAGPPRASERRPAACCGSC